MNSPEGVLGSKTYCFCQNVTVFQNVSRESRRASRAVTRAPMLKDGMRPVHTRVGACSFGERANSESMKNHITGRPDVQIVLRGKSCGARYNARERCTIAEREYREYGRMNNKYCIYTCKNGRIMYKVWKLSNGTLGVPLRILKA